MRVTIVAVGLRQPSWADEAVKDYLSRFPRDFAVAVKEVRAETRSGQPAAKLMAAEAERISKAIPAGDIVVALDEHGRDLTTMDFAKKIESWQNEGVGVSFVIGGADGLDAEIKKSARLARLCPGTLVRADLSGLVDSAQPPLSPRIARQRCAPAALFFSNSTHDAKTLLSQQKSPPQGNSRFRGRH